MVIYKAYNLEEGMQSTPVLLPRESHAQRSGAGFSPSGRMELGTTEAAKQQQHKAYKILKFQKFFNFTSIFLFGKCK